MTRFNAALALLFATVTGCRRADTPAHDDATHPEGEAAADDDVDAHEDAAAADEVADGVANGAANSEAIADEEAIPETSILDLPPALKQAQDEIKRSVADAQAKLEAELLVVAQKQAEVNAAKNELNTRLDTISALEKRLNDLLGVGDVAERRRLERIDQLAKLLASMTPQAAANVVAEMRDEDAQALLLAISRTSERKASKLLSALPGQRAAQLGGMYLQNDPKKLTRPKQAAVHASSAAEPSSESTP